MNIIVSNINLTYIYDNYKEIRNGSKPYKTNDNAILQVNKTVKK